MNYANACDFDLTDNYIALLACIISDATVDECVRKIALQSRRDERKKPSKPIKINKKQFKKTYVFDIDVGEIHEFESGKEAALKYGLSPSAVGFYIKNNYKYRQRYIFTRDKDFKYKA